MSKSSLAGLIVSALTLCGVVFAAVQLSGLRTSVSGLEDRVARLEAAPPASRPGPVISSTELATLRSELDRLMKLQKETVVIPGDGAQGGLTADDLNKAIEESLKLREKESRARISREMFARVVVHTEKFHKTLAGQLKLSEAAGAQLKDILDEQMKRYKEAMESGAPSQEVGKQLEAINADVNESIRAILTPEQQKRFADIPDSKKWFGGLGARKANPDSR